MISLRRAFFALCSIVALSVPALAQTCGPIPALPDTERRTEYSGIVSQTGPFNVGFQIYGDQTDYGNWISVWVNGVQKTAVTDFTVATASGPAIGAACRPIQNAQVTFLAAQTGTIEIVGARRPRRASQFSENAGVTAHSLNQVISDLTAMERERWDATARTMRAPPGEALSVLPPAATRAGRLLSFDGGGNPLLLSPTPGLGNVLGPATSVVGNVARWDNTTGTLLKDGGVIAPSIEDYGARTTNTGAQNLTAIQNAIAATPTGGTLAINKAGYQVAGNLVINKNMKLVCANTDQTVAANLIETTASSNLLSIRAGYVTVDGCSLAMAGSPTGSATGILLGDDAISASGTFNGTTLLNCGTCTFTSADIGKSVYATSVGAAGGPLFTSISAIVDSHNVTMANAATGSATVTFGYGFNYQEIVLRDVQVYNFVTGINVVAATQYHIRHAYVLSQDALLAQNILWSDQGDGSVTDSTFIAAFAGVHNTVSITSGGGLRFQNNKVLAEAAISNCIQVFWNGVSSVGPWIIGNSIEGGCGSGIAVNGNAAAAHGGMIIGNEIGIASAGTSINANPTNAHPNWIITNNLIRQTGGGSGILLANMTNVLASNNNGQNTDGNGGGLLYGITSTSSGAVYVSATDITNPIQNASANVTIDDPIGLAFASLPSAAKNGSKIFVTNGTPGSSPCTGAGTGATAFRQNGAWVCGQAAITALTGDVTASGSGSVVATLANIPSGVPMAGSIIAANIAAPSSPAAAHVSLFADSTDLRFHDKNASGVIGTTVVADTGAANNFLTAISAAGVISKAQPSAANLSNGTTGSGAVVLAASPTLSGTIGGALTFSGTHTLSAALTYGGVTLNNAVTGTGNMVLSVSPQITTSLSVGTQAANGSTVSISSNATTWSGAVAGANNQLQMVAADSNSAVESLDSFGTFSFLALRRTNGTAASATAVNANDIIGGMFAYAWRTSGGNGYNVGASVQLTASENQTSTNGGQLIDFFTVANTTTTRTQNVRIQASGGLSIGATTDPGVGGLFVNGATITLNGLATDATHTDRTVCQDTTSKSLFFGSGAAGICLGTSSATFKHDINRLDAGLNEILKLQPVSYKLNADHGDPDKLLYGFTAEQGAGVLPDLVGLDKDGKPQTFDYMGVVPVLVRAVQQLKADNDNLRREFEVSRRKIK